MIIIPAIDIKEGKVVRLKKGHFDEVTIYTQDPLTYAQHWISCGAQWLHVVDLDGAESGIIKNFEMIVKIAKTVKVPIQMGGGVRTKENINRLLKAGISRVVLGTKVVQDQESLKDILKQWPDKIAVSVDCSKGKVAQKGWKEISNISAIDFVRKLEGYGLKHLIYTDIARDGMLEGPNIDGLKEILNTVNMSIIASGGISGIDDIKHLRELNAKNLTGVITGKAIYEGKLDLKAAIDLCAKTQI